MSSRLAFTLIRLAILAAACVACFYCGKKSVGEAVTLQVDTLLVHDTIVRSRPVYVREKVVDTLLVPVSSVDTLLVHDSIFISLPRQERVYADSAYYAVVSGYRPSLDSLAIFQSTLYITRTEVLPAPRWGLGVSAGPSVLVDASGSLRAGLGVSAGVYFRF